MIFILKFVPWNVLTLDVCQVWAYKFVNLLKDNFSIVVSRLRVAINFETFANKLLEQGTFTENFMVYCRLE